MEPLGSYERRHFVQTPFSLRCTAASGMRLDRSLSYFHSPQNMKRIFFALFLTAFLSVRGAAAPDPLQTSVTDRDADESTYAEWTDGTERPLKPKSPSDHETQPAWILMTGSAVGGHSGVTFGDSNTPGPRHLRLGFKAPIAAGSFVVRGGGRLSVLKPEAAYPGKLDDDSQWIPAERIVGGKVSNAEAGNDDYAVWVLPRAVETRALRFTHNADITEKKYAGWLGGVCVLPSRVANLAPQATATASANGKAEKKINNESIDGIWGQWANIDVKSEEHGAVISAEHPETILLTWPVPVKLHGVGVLHVGFGTAEVQAYVGRSDVHPREADESGWKTIKSFAGLKNCYPASMGGSFLDFGQDVTTRALRLRITAPQAESGHPHMAGHTKGGTRIWLGECLALTSLTDNTLLQTAVLPPEAPSEHPPIPVKFTLSEAGWVTLVIEDSQGKRVRNLISDVHFEKGENTAWWDGSDDLGRDVSAASHGLYLIPTQFVPPGAYRVRGLWHKQVDVRYEMGVYTGGETPWETGDRTGGWLANHTPPSAALFVPDALGQGPTMLIGSYVSEGTAGLAWLDLDGHKWKGQNWVGGTWTGAPFLARDTGAHALPDVYAYVAAAWEAVKEPKGHVSKAEIRITGLTNKEDKAIAKISFVPTQTAKGAVDWKSEMGGIAAHDGLLVASLMPHNKLIFIEAQTGKTAGELTIPSPRGVAFDGSGRLLVLSGKSLVRFAAPLDPAKPGTPETVIATGLEDSSGLTIDDKGTLYVSDRGNSHQVKAFTASGKLVRTYGHAGVPKAGPYDSAHMNHPRGLAVDSQGRLWVAEEDYQPKRVSVWTSDGTLAKTFYGPCEYGGGGQIDPEDRTKFYYNGMEFALDWTKGADHITSIFYRPEKEGLPLAFRSGPPQTVFHFKDRRYWTDTYNSNPTGGHSSSFLFTDRNGVAVPCAAAGNANEWDLLKDPKFASVWPAGSDPNADPHTDKSVFFFWNDLNGDGQVQPEELTLKRGRSGSISVQSDLSFVVSRFDGKAIQWAPIRFTDQGVPIYNLEAGKTVVDGVQNPPSSGGDQVLVAADGWSVETTATKPFDPHGLSGAKNGVPMWSYPSPWPGLHASHEAPAPDRPGMIVGHTRLLGDFIKAGSETMWMLNGNPGMIYVFTEDGLFVTQLFQDMRLGRHWGMPKAERGMLLNDITPGDENFWPSVTRTPDGAVLLNAGRTSSLLQVTGLETVRRLDPIPLQVTTEDIDHARDYFTKAEAARQAARGRGILTVALRNDAPVVDGKLDDWSTAAWADIDKRGTGAYFNSNSKPYDVTGAVCISGRNLYAAWKTGDKDLLKNSGDVPNAPFKTGGALDLMIGANPDASPKRLNPVEGDTRLLVTMIGGKPKALLYRAVVAGAKDPVPFSSPGRTIHFDRVDDVSSQVQLASDGNGDFEISVPLDVLGLKPASGQKIQGDIGILRGTGNTTTQRVYWSNKATNIVADVPSEAELKPGLWGRWEFK